MAPGDHDVEDSRGRDIDGLEEQACEPLLDRLRGLQARLARGLNDGENESSGEPATLCELISQLETSTDALLLENQRQRDRIERTNLQFGELVEVVMGLAALDYTQRATVYEGQDDATNALAIGLNMMCEELEHATTELIHTRDVALAANRAKTTFLANMSHEFRTPLNAIIGYSELLYEEYGPSAHPTMVSDLERINSAARHLLALIQDTLDISKIEAEKLDLELRPIHLPELLADIVATITPMIHQHTNRFEFIQEFEVSIMLGDSTRLRQVLLNLLSNASKFTSEGVVTLRVSEHENDGQHTIDFAVSDTGIGIESGMLDSIFEAFSQADDSTTRMYGGTGLGLTISRRLCEMMGGSLTVTSRVGHGSTFVASVPIPSTESMG